LCKSGLCVDVRLLMKSVTIPPRMRAIAAGLIAAGGAAFLARWLHHFEKLQSWFFFDLATIWLWQIYLCVACVSAGAVVVRRLLPAGDRTRLETIAYAYPVGLVAFVLGMYLGGFLHLFGPVFAVVWPALMIAAGARQARAAWQQARAAGTLPTLTLRGLPLVLSLIGLLFVGLLYLGAMSPGALNYDARWCHLVIAQDYAREGHIVKFPGGWTMNLPHLASMVYTWAFTVPGLDLPQLRWMMALHSEFVAVVWTLVGIAATARWLAQRDAAGTWVAFLLFPGLYVYDHNIGGAADHFVALFAAPLLPVLGMTLRRFDRGPSVLLGTLAGAALATKLQAHYLLVPIGLAALGRGVWLAIQRRRRDGATDVPTLRAIGSGYLLAVAAVFVVMLPHLATNLVYYGNPLYPFAQGLFNGVTDPRMIADKVMPDYHFRPPEILSARLRAAAGMSFAFSFVPHYSFIDYLPMFGSVFTLALPLLLVIRDGRRLWLGTFITMGTLFMWAFMYWVDRNLQTFLPLMVAVTAAILVRAWELGWFARIGVIALVLVQIAWGTGLYFSGSDRMSGALFVLSSTIRGKTHEVLRSSYASEYVAIGNALPADAVVMLHAHQLSLGIDRPVYLDWLSFQDQIDYAKFKTPRALYERLRALGVTHLVWPPPQRPAPSRQEEIIWGVFAESLRPQQKFGDLTLAPMPVLPPPDDAPYQVLVIGMPDLPDGLYPIEMLSSSAQLPPVLRFYAKPARRWSPDAFPEEAKVVMMGAAPREIDAATQERFNTQFKAIAATAGGRILVRR